ncbi:baculoviral IAP repeat-containing protein 7 isoform X1 [Electrophorus electricus]|uniref:RING-type E3 ubiquitin transferase n=1 Tax=Electrophorus electricus TaxID=8005 RepID=A0A4W4HRT6_ELEEL|nr:baculoviral IAP repeat-containing protein 7 isoform X1 [Electrophorus electricus]
MINTQRRSFAYRDRERNASAAYCAVIAFSFQKAILQSWRLAFLPAAIYHMASGGFEPYLYGPLWDVRGMTGNENEGPPGSRRDTGARFGTCSEEDRLRTFQNWPRDAPVTPADLARAGFYFLESDDAVRCFCCKGTLKDWVRGDHPFEEHRRHFPACDFVLGRNVGNVARPARSTDSVDGQVLSQQMQEQVTTGQAVCPEMGSEESRLATFHNWPRGALIQPDALARAGFFYTGHGDNVTCFFCDGALRDWESGDNPWQEHAKWFPRCEFLLQARGQENVNTIQQSYVNTSEMVGAIQTPTAGHVPTNHESLSGVEAAVSSPVVQAALQMGFQRALVEGLAQSRYLLTGHQYTSISNLVADILREEEEQGSEPSTDPVARQGGSTGGMTTQASAAQNLSTEERLRQLQEERTCKVCMDHQVSMVFIPCGHLVVCRDCAASLHHCPICRSLIRGSVYAFMS